jgi:hypothetical protein
MRISTAIIDCWLYVRGQSYSDFQHHHWEVMPSGTIDATVNNRPTYIWALNESGTDSNGSWSAISQSKTLNNGAEVRISSPTTVSLTQTQGFGVNQLPAHGSSSVTAHTVSELIWPTDLTWHPGHGTPSSITYRDSGAPTYQLVSTPVVVPGSRKDVLLLVESIVLIPGAGGFGGRDWTHEGATFYQKPAAASALAWWAWTINLAV